MPKFKQHPLYKNCYLSKTGDFYIIRMDGSRSAIRKGTIARNKAGKPLCYEVCLTIEKGKYKVINVGRLVLETFVGFAPDDKPEIDHIDRNPLNNTVTNLRWANRAENCKNRIMPCNNWTEAKHTKRLATAQAMGYATWGDLLKAGRAKAKAKRAQENV